MDNTVGNIVRVKEEHEILHVLIVDDEDLAHALGKTIEQLGHKAEVAGCYKEALKKIAEVNFDLILLDMNLSNGDGIDFISEIRQSVEDLNIVAMTSDPNRELEQKLREQRVIYYMIKPFELDELRSIINHLSRRKIKFHSKYGHRIEKAVYGEQADKAVKKTNKLIQQSTTHTEETSGV